jgi:hypothetical protein
MKPFTVIAGLLFLLGAAVHAYRLYHGFPVVIADHVIPQMASWVFLGVGLVFGVMLLSEARR